MSQSTLARAESTAETPGVPAPGSAARYALLTHGLRFGIVLGLLALWQYASGRWVDAILISSPTEIAARFVELIQNGQLWRHTQVTFVEIILGYVLGAGLGLAVGFGLAQSRLWADVFEPMILGFYGIPRTALAPLFIIWLGIGIASKVGVVALMSFFLVFFNTYAGLRGVDRDYVNLARLFGADRFHLIWRVLLPAASPTILVGLKTAVPQAVIGATVGEFIASSEGLGYFIRRAAGTFDAAGLFVGVIMLLVLVLVANWLLDLLERRLMAWRQATAIGNLE
ncbi:MAG TPA: ABC transporter permease [Chloroflexota bacterium]|jgi:NitT/TauT family transport system permease protein